MNITKTRLLTGLIAAGLGLGLASNANATAAYAVSYNDITNFGISTTAGATTFGAPQFTSATTANLNAVNAAAGGITILDSPVSCLGTPCGGVVNNNFVTVGEVGSPYGMGDAIIVNTGILAGTGQATNMAEGDAHQGTAGGSGKNTVSTSFSVDQVGTVLQFDFDAAPYLGALVDDALDSATASLTMSISISDGGGNTIFSWAPGGSAGGIIGGVETLDPYNLNGDITATGGVLVAQDNLAGYSIAAVGTSGFDFGADAGATPGAFQAATNALGIGEYTLTVTMEEDVTLIDAVPLPATVLLFGLGLFGLGLIRRKA